MNQLWGAKLFRIQFRMWQIPEFFSAWFKNQYLATMRGCSPPFDPPLLIREPGDILFTSLVRQDWRYMFSIQIPSLIPERRFLNFLFCTFLPTGASTIWWFFISVTVISNDTVQCFGRNEWCQQCYLQQLWMTWSTPEDAPFLSLGAYKVDQKTIFGWKNRFFQPKWLNFANFRDSWSENCVS